MFVEEGGVVGDTTKSSESARNKFPLKCPVNDDEESAKHTHIRIVGGAVSAREDVDSGSAALPNLHQEINASGSHIRLTLMDINSSYKMFMRRQSFMASSIAYVPYT